MCEVGEEQINCEFETEREVPIFDQDNWVSEDETRDINSSKEIVLKDTTKNYDPQFMDKIDQELASSKENFFKVKITQKKVTKKEAPVSKSLKRIESLIENNPNSILKQGNLDKKTDSLIFKWKTRYFALTSEKLFFFEDSSKKKVVGCVNLKLLPTDIKIENDEIILDFMGECENMVLKCEEKKACNEWVEILREVIKYHGKEKKLLLKTLIKPLYNCQDSMTEKELSKIAETGDILLFYTRNTGAKIQRVITNSDYDHVAMVVKFRKNEMMVFESNQMYGVSVYEWGQYIRYFDLYDKVTLRKLNYVRKSELHHSLLNFVKKNIGKKYDISASKFLKLESDFNWEQVNQEETRGYFCSELIAKAYKSVGLIDQKKFSGRYWPVDFSEKKEIELKNGAYLGSEQSIILNRNIKNNIL